VTRVLIALSAAIVSAPLAGAAGERPSLSLVQVTPPRLHGTHFKAGEKVTVTLVTGARKLRRTAHVSPTGEFTVIFGEIAPVSSCGHEKMTLVAVGGSGDRSALQLPPSGCKAVAPTVTTSTPGLAPPPSYTK
jgi:hypothetical protein